MIFNVSNIKIEINGLKKSDFPANICQFVDSVCCLNNYVIKYSFFVVKCLPMIAACWKPIYNRNNICVYRYKSLELRVLSFNEDAAYAVYVEIDQRHVTVFYLDRFRKELSFDNVFASCLALERHFAKEEAFVLHCSFLKYGNQSILFSGPSGIGKSTHADIWSRHIDGASVINGDRSLIVRNSDGIFTANGWPVCGSSGICHIGHYPIKAIVFIEQSQINHIIQEDEITYYKRLTAQFMINHWDREITSEAMNFITGLMEKVTVLTYGCNMTPDAALFLKCYLYERY